MEIREVTKCRNCEQESNDKPAYLWRKVNIYDATKAKVAEGVAIYCGMCHKTITVLPLELFPLAED